MNVSDVMDIEQSHGNSVALKAGDKITIQGFHVKYVEGVGSDIAEIKTTEGTRHSFGRALCPCRYMGVRSRQHTLSSRQRSLAED